METKRHSHLFVVALFVICLLLVACQPSTSTAADSFDYQKAADNQAARWKAMGEYYEKSGLLTFDYEKAAEVQAARWRAMADFYQKAGMLNDSSSLDNENRR
jgi:hypothetical protein